MWIALIVGRIRYLSSMATCFSTEVRKLQHPHSTYSAEVAPPETLLRIYKHARDGQCVLDEREHKYLVRGLPYQISVSGVWAEMFPRFDVEKKTLEIVRRTLRTPGVKKIRGKLCVESSAWNFVQVCNIGLALRVDETLELLGEVLEGSPDEILSEVVAELVNGFLVPSAQKPEGPSCYYFALRACHSRSEEEMTGILATTWEMSGQMESLKGTILHKRAELYIDALAQEIEQGRVPALSPLRDITAPDASDPRISFETALKHVACSQREDVWNHSAFQRWLEAQEGEQVEFTKFVSWTKSVPMWTPYRTEWSIFDEEYGVAGQIDSVWIDTEQGSFMMADWKRAREILCDDPRENKRRSFNEKGYGQCADLWNCSYSHYLVQQNLYALILSKHYGVNITRLYLVQCHPQVTDDFNECELPLEEERSRLILAQTGVILNARKMREIEHKRRRIEAASEK